MNNYITLKDLPFVSRQNSKLVLNIEANWCPDCTERQKPHLAEFASKLKENDIAFYQLVVQEQRGVFLTPEHEAFVESVGGHGYPRTVFFQNGSIASKDHVEIITSEQLTKLAEQFIAKTKK